MTRSWATWVRPYFFIGGRLHHLLLDIVVHHRLGEGLFLPRRAQRGEHLVQIAGDLIHIQRDAGQLLPPGAAELHHLRRLLAVLKALFHGVHPSPVCFLYDVIDYTTFYQFSKHRLDETAGCDMIRKVLLF